MINLSQLEQRLNYKFKNVNLLKQALTHKSYSKDNYERLEFVGDGVLDYVIAVNLYHKYSDLAEGDLSKMRAALVNQTTLAEIAQQIHLGQFLFLGDGEQSSGGRTRESILADSLEAIFAAVSLDASVIDAQSVIENVYHEKLQQSDTIGTHDSKSLLQEYLQARQLSPPEYDVIKTTGPDHDSIFHVKCSIESLKLFVIATGKSKKSASQAAASAMLQKINKEKHGK